MANERWEPVDKCQHKTEDPPGVVRLEYGDLLTVRDELGAATVELPDDLRLCRRVPDQLITPEALEAAGWECEPTVDSDQLRRWAISIRANEYTALGVTIDEDEHLNLLVHVWEVWGSEDDDKQAVPLPGCTTMAQLRALVELLGGG